MTLPKHVWANVRGLWVRYLSLFLLGLVAVGTVSTSRLLSHAAEHSMTSQVAESVAQRAITVESDHEAGGRLLDPTALQELAQLPGVASVEPTYPVSIDVELPDVPLGLDVVPVRPSIPPPLVARTREQVWPLRDGELVLPARVDERDLRPLLGTTVSVAHPEGMGAGASRSVPGQAVVVALSDPAWQDDGPRSGYASAAVVEQWFADAAKPATMAAVLAEQGVDKATVVTTSSADVPGVLRAVQGKHLSAVAFQQLTPALPDAVTTVSRVTDVLQWVLGVVCALAVFVLVRSLVLQRTREIGLLKALGHSSGRITGTLFLESLLVSWLACAASVVVSLVVVNVLRPVLPAGLLPAAVSGVWGVDWAVFGGSLAVSAVVVAVGGALPFLRALRLDAAEALRDWR